MGDTTSRVIIDVLLNAEDSAKKADDLAKSIKSIKDEQSGLKKSGQDSTVAYAQISASIRTLTAEQKAYISISQNAAGSNNELRAKLALLTNQYNALGKEERDGTNAGKAYQAQIKAISDELKKNESAVGDNRRNVGNYTQAIVAARGETTSLADSARSVIQGFGFFPTALSGATGSITNFVNSQRSVIQGFQTIKQLQADAATATTEATAATEAAAVADAEYTAGKITEAEAIGAAAVATEAQTAATVLQAEATTAAAGATGLLKIALASTGIGLLILGLGTLVTYFNNTNEGAKKIKVIFAEIGAVVQESFKTLGSYGKLLFDVVSGNFSKLGEDLNTANTNLKNFVGNSIDAAKAAGEVTKERQALTKAERENSELAKKQQGDIDLLIKKLRDQNIPEAERIKLSEKAIALSDTKFKKDLELAKQNESLVEREQALNSKKDYQAITDAKNVVQEKINAHNNQVQTIENRESRLTQTQERELNKRDAAEQKSGEKSIKAGEELAKSKLASAASTLTARQREYEEVLLDIDKRENQYKEYNNVVAQLEVEKHARISALARKFADEDTEIVKDAITKSTEARVAMLPEGIAKEESLQQAKNERELTALDKQILDRNSRIIKGEEDKNSALDALLAERTAIVERQQNDAFQKELAADIAEDNADNARRAANLQVQQDAKQAAFEQDRMIADAKKELDNAIIESASGVTGTIVGLLGENSEAGKFAFVFEQGLAIAKIILNAELEKSAINLAAGEQAAKYAAIPIYGEAQAAAAFTLAAIKTATITAREIGSVAVIAAQTVGKLVSGKAKGGIQGLDYKSDGRGTILPGYSTYDDLNAHLRSGEAVIVSEAVKDPHTRNLLSLINQWYGGRSLDGGSPTGAYSAGGTYYAGSFAQQTGNDISAGLQTAAVINAAISRLNLVVSVTDINTAQANYARTVDRATF